MTEPAFDETIHPPHRLQICSMLAAADSVAFATAREALGVSESVLSKQIKVLREAGYLTLTKTPRHAHSRTWLALTPCGRRAFTAHMAELHRLLNVAAETRS